MTRPLLLLLLSAFLSSCVWDQPTDNPDYLPLDDSRYPYAGIPRMVIETLDFSQIRDNSTMVPAVMQVYGGKGPESNVMELSIRGRGSASYRMPKHSYKIELERKSPLLGMSKDKDWALIANFGDKSHLRNLISYKLASLMGAEYSPQCRYVELYLNRNYMGLFLLVETVKIGKNRINVIKDENTFLIEKETAVRSDPPLVKTEKGSLFHIKHPLSPSQEKIQELKDYLDSWESYLRKQSFGDIESRLDLTSYFSHYWTQELSKNVDGNFGRSVYVYWHGDDPIHFGPVWDFDLAYGNSTTEAKRQSSGWYARKAGWHSQLFRNKKIDSLSKSYWREHQAQAYTLLDTISKYSKEISGAIQHEFDRWPDLQSRSYWAYRQSFSSYDEVIDSLQTWYKRRMNWIDEQL